MKIPPLAEKRAKSEDSETIVNWWMQQKPEPQGEAYNIRFNPTNPLTRGLLEDSGNPRAKPFGHGFAG